MAKAADLFKVINQLKLCRFYGGSLRKRMDGKIKANYLSEGQTGYIFANNTRPQTHPGLVFAVSSSIEPPDIVGSTIITKEIADQLDPAAIVVDDMGDVFHPYVPAMEYAAKPKPRCVSCLENLDLNDYTHNEEGYKMWVCPHCDYEQSAYWKAD